MTASSRRKGVTGEREVAVIFQTAGFDVRNLEGQGDHLVTMRGRVDEDGTAYMGGPFLHLEVKRAERLKLPEWLRQAASEAPQGTIPVVTFRQSRQEWYACLKLSDLVELAS